MGEPADNIDKLRNLGLTPLQAKIYITLVKCGKQKVQKIAEKIGTDRANTYQGISQLQKRGLVRKILGSPVIYEAVSLQESIKLLLKQKEIEYTTKKMLKHYYSHFNRAKREMETIAKLRCTLIKKRK